MKRLDQNHVLTKIIEAKRARLQKSRLRTPEAIVRRMARDAKPSPSFRLALESGGPVRIIAEIKKASPSKGVLRADLNVEELAAAYASGGAAAISVVTEEDYFQGDLGWIAKAQRASNLPVLRKDFVFDPVQLYETRAAGASAVLLIAAMLDVGTLRQFVDLAQELSLDALVEVHDESELQEALETGARIIGVNNRNLKTFNVDLETSRRLSKLIPDDRLFVVESGVLSPEDLTGLLDAGADAFLIGEYFVTSNDPAAVLRGLL